MSAAAAADAAPPAKGRKKLLIIIVVAVVLLAVAGAGAMLLLKKKAHADDDDGDADHAPAKAAAAHKDPKAVPTFVPLEPFTVNLADRDAERYAQVGITLEVGDPHVGDQIKSYMPAIRNNILMALAEKNAAQLMDRGGKSRLAEQIRRETARAMGYEVGEPKADRADDRADDKADDRAAKSGRSDEADDGDKPKKKHAKKKAQAESPITGVHFSNFIIQ